MRSQDSPARRLTLCAVLIALALGLSLIDTAVSSLLAFIPGFKLGLANIVSLFALGAMGLPWALLVSAARCFLGAVFAGQTTMFLFSILGALGSLLVMRLLIRRLSIVKVSTAGGICHNLMQLVAAGIFTATPSLIYYLPVLICLGTITGFCLGILCALVFIRLPKGKAFRAGAWPDLKA